MHDEATVKKALNGILARKREQVALDFFFLPTRELVYLTGSALGLGPTNLIRMLRQTEQATLTNRSSPCFRCRS